MHYTAITYKVVSPVTVSSAAGTLKSLVLARYSVLLSGSYITV